jgi:hypothetical protein
LEDSFQIFAKKTNVLAVSSQLVAYWKVAASFEQPANPLVLPANQPASQTFFLTAWQAGNLRSDDYEVG